MEYRREVKEEEEIVEEKAEESPNEAHKSATFSDPTPQTRDLSIRGRCRAWEKGPAVSASLGAMRALVRKLDMLLLDPPRACSSESVKENMQLLKEDVEEISSCLDTLSQLEDPPQMAKCWMNEVRDLSYNLEDYIDSLHVQAAETSLAADSINTTRSHRKWFSCVRTPKKPTWDEQIVETVSEFRIYIHNAMKRHKMYGLQFFSTLRRTLVPFVHMLPTATPYEETSDIVVNDSMNKFINSLPNDGADQQQLKVVSVLGSSCLGKTTLARVLYKRIGLQFDCRAFVRVSKNPDMKKIFQDMLSQLERQQCPPQYSKEGDLINKIKNYLQGKRYLVIIDDLWSASVWDSINHAFPKVSHGSRIITTTQNEDIAFRCCHYQSEQVFEMKPLDDRHSRKLFFNRLFGSESKCPEQFKNVSNQIIALCGGLPLATIIIASLLASQPVMTEDLLQHIHESLSSLCSANPTSERTRQALNLSFNNLPQYLKTCLLYVSMYQEGYIFCQNDLVKQWMAEGFIDTTKGEDMEEVAKSYLHQLIGRRFIQPIRINYNNEVLSCAVHDVVHDLIAQKSAEDNFIVAIDHSEKNVAHPHKARRLSILFDDARYAKSPAYTIKSQVRSLTFVGLFECMPSITEFKLLRVLNLQLPGYGGCKGLCRDNNTVDLSVISELSRLRYLKIASHLFIKLPDYMGGLHCLETLDIVDAVVLKFGIGVRLPHLLHFYLSLHDERNVDNWIDKLKHLQELRLMFPSAGPSSQEENLLVLRDFISGHDNLKVIVGACDSSDKVIDGTSDATIPWVDMAPPPLLERFEFSPHRSCIFPMIPPWVEKHNNLSILKIAVKELGMMCVGILRGLPALTALSLYVETMPAEKIIFDKPGFSVLKYIKLRFMSGVALLKFEADVMPNVLKLKLVFNAVPQINQYEHGIINIDHMPGLREICVKFVGAATGPEYALVSNHQSNPIINRKSSVCNSFDDKSTNQKLQTYEILKGERDEIVEEERDDHGTESKTPVDQRILRSPVSSSRPHVPDSGLDIQNLQREVKTRWLKPREVLDILRNCELLGIQNRTPQRPPSGSWFLFNRRVHLFFRNDGYVWQKKRNGRSGNEAHEYLKVDNVKALNCYYARAENKPTFMRRIYWMLEPAYEHIVLVHYRDILEGSISVSALNGSPTSNQNGSASRADAHSSPGLTSEIIAPLLNSCSPGSAEEVSSQIPTINTETNDISLFDWRRTLEMQLSLENKERHDVNTDEVLPNHDPIPVHGIQNEELDACINLADVFELGFSEDNHAEGSHPYLDPIDDVLKYSETCWDWEDDQLNPILHPASVTVDENQRFHIHEVSPEWAFCSESAKVVIAGDFPCNPPNSSWVLFGDFKVPAEIVQEGVIRCYTPCLGAGKVRMCMLDENGKPCSEDREFDFIEKPTSTMINGNGNPCSEAREFEFQQRPTKSDDELLLLFNYVQMLFDSHGCEVFSKFRLPLPNVQSGFPVNPSEIIGRTCEQLDRESTVNCIMEVMLNNKFQDWLSSKFEQNSEGRYWIPKQYHGVIHTIAALGYDWALKPLLSSGVPINYRDANGWTALHWAARFGREQMVAVLVTAGAAVGALSDPTAEDPAAKTPASIAYAYGFKGLSAFLSEAELTSTLHSLESKENGNPIDHNGGVSISSAVDRISDKCAHVDGGTDDQLALKDSLGAIRNAVQAAGRIQATFRVFSLKKKKEKALQNGDSSASPSMLGRAALSIQKNFRCWKKRKEFQKIRKNVIKIQARFRAHRERNKYKELLQSVGILEKIMLRWFRKGVGLRGIGSRMPIEQDEEEDIVKVFRKERVETAVNEAVSRVSAIVGCPVARLDYRRMLEIHQQAKIGHGN